MLHFCMAKGSVQTIWTESLLKNTGCFLWLIARFPTQGDFQNEPDVSLEKFSACHSGIHCTTELYECKAKIMPVFSCLSRHSSAAKHLPISMVANLVALYLGQISQLTNMCKRLWHSIS